MRLLFATASAVIILAGIRATSALLLPFVLAMFLALVSFPLVRWLQAHGLPRGVAVATAMLAVLAALLGPGLLVITTIRRFVTAVPQYEVQLRQIVGGLFDWLRARDIDTTYLNRLIDPARVLDVVTTALTGMITLLSATFLVVLIAAFILFEAADIMDHRRHAFPPRLGQHLERIAGELQTWLWVKTIVSLATGAAAGLWVGMLSVDFAVLWGLVAFLLNYIPNLGSLIAAFPPVLLAVIQYGPFVAFLVLIGYVVINTVFGNFVEPYLMGRRVSLAPLVVLLSIIVWGWMWGIAGMLVSVPITMGIKVALESSDDLRWLARLMEGDAAAMNHRDP